MPSDLGLTKNGLADIRNQIAQGLPAHFPPREFLRQHSDMMDGLVRKAFQAARAKVPSPSVCLMAIGGYGRAELAPYSDIDLLLLYSPSNKNELSPLAEQILYPLWDLGLDVSCSSRSIDECLKMACSDAQVKTGLIDGRYLDGEYEFFRNLYGLFTKKVLHRRVQSFAEALAQEVHPRRQKYEDPAYVLEPNIKEGEGGLRDFQVGRWIIRAKYKTDRWDSILFPDHSRMLDKSIQFLWAIRNHLHLLSGRRQDDLTFELQEKIAPLLGFPMGTKGVEEMMRQYHLSARGISNFFHDILDRALYEPSAFRKMIFFFQRKRIDENFEIAHGELHLLDPVAFKKDPSQVMTLFQHGQAYQAKLDFRTEEAVMEALPFIDDRFRASQKVNQAFLSILRKGEGVDRALKKMHELGFLSNYLPEFSEIEGKVHYDLYHVHPVDIHSILAVEELGRLRDGYYQKDYPLLTSLIREIEKPDILFLTTLLHDIGKGKQGDHPSVGADMVNRIGWRMGLPVEDRGLMDFLVRHHLLMLETAFRRNLHDEQAILRFANETGNPVRLKMLYLLTFADIKAVGPEAWTSWKNSLLMELFLKTSHFFEKGDEPQSFLKMGETVAQLRQSLPRETLSHYAEHLPDRYLSTYSSGEISYHIGMAQSLDKEVLLAEWSREEEVRARVTICTKDRYGLFSKIAGSMFVNRLNILEAQIHTWGNGVALDTFYVEDPTGEIERRLQQFKKDLKEILSGKISLKLLLSQREESGWIQKKVIPKVTGETKVNNQDSDFYTIIEITGEDRLGVLYEITQALTDCGCNIHFARISTLGNRVVDVFYVQDEWGEKIVEPEKANHLKQLLLNRLTPL
ncbi:MAG: [protein-PII] uridylyltransferase [Deltaproteobacteria bacterium]|nr:[protein-PII] uridylyltransferase [Deltaproteobacteria bacterium]